MELQSPEVSCLIQNDLKLTLKLFKLAFNFNDKFTSFFIFWLKCNLKPYKREEAALGSFLC